MAIYWQDVVEIIDTTVEDENIVNAMMSTAERMIADNIDPADPDLSVATRDEIKKWLSAHFLAIYDRQEKEMSADGVRFLYDGKTDLGLNATLWGQQAMMVDPTGELAKLNSGTRRTLKYYVSENPS